MLFLAVANIRKISGITEKNGRNDAKRLDINIITVPNNDKSKNKNEKKSRFKKENGWQIITRERAIFNIC